MSSGWNERRLARRARPANGRPLAPFRWWQLFRRSLFSITLEMDGRPVVHTVEVRHGGDANGVVRARLYVDGELASQSRLPAMFPVAGGHVEVRRSQGGMRRCHLVADDGTERALTPDPRSAEGRRMLFARDHPRASALVGVASIVLLLVGVGLGLLQVVGPLSQIPAIADAVGVVEAPVRLPVWVNVALGLGASAAAIERALRLQYHWLLDSGAGT